VSVQVCCRSCDGGGAEEANQHDWGHLAGAEVLLKPSCPESHGLRELSPSPLQEGSRPDPFPSPILSYSRCYFGIATIKVPWFWNPRTSLSFPVVAYGPVITYSIYWEAVAQWIVCWTSNQGIASLSPTAVSMSLCP